MSVVPLAIEVSVICVLAVLLLHRYGNWRKQHILVTLATFIAWYFSLMIVFIIPLDVSSTCYRQCIEENKPRLTTALSTTPVNGTNRTLAPTSPSNFTSSINNISAAPVSYAVQTEPSEIDICRKPWSYVPDSILPILWRVVYWTSQVLTWLVLPMMQSYACAGDFTVLGKLKRSLIENAIYYGTYLLIFGVCLIYVAIRPDINIDGPHLKIIGITASNTWGLTLLVLLLGYGLVEIPRSCWNNAKQGYKLAHTQFKISKLSTEKTEAEENLEDVLEDVKKAADTIRLSNPLRKHVETILAKCPESVQKAVERRRKQQRQSGEEDEVNPTETPTYKSLVRLHQNLIKSMQAAQRTEVQWDMLIEEAFDLEDVAQNERSTSRRYIRSTGDYEGILKWCCTPTIEWYWKCMIKPWGLRFLSIILIGFSLMVVWSECLFFVRKPVLSLFAIFIQIAKQNYDYFYIELICTAVIGYLCVCAYYTVFKIRIFNYYYIASHHQTNEKSLMFSGMLLCRLTPPMCLNFLGMIHMDSHIIKKKGIIETAYTRIMGHMDVIKFISSGFNIYFPIAIVLLCIATYFNLCGRCLQFLGFQQFVGDDDMTQELIEEGKQLIQRERRKRQRTEDGENRRRTWNERFGEGDSTRGPARDGSDSDTSYRKWRGGHSSARSPTENDRTELLKQAEPIDYTSDNKDTFDDFSGGPSVNNREEYNGYHSREGRGRGYSSTRTANKPPRGIFDDV